MIIMRQQGHLQVKLPPPTTVIEWTKVEGIEHCFGDGAFISFDTSIDTEQACSTKSQNDCSGDCIWHVDKCLILSKTIAACSTRSQNDCNGNCIWNTMKCVVRSDDNSFDAASCYNQCLLDDPFNDGNHIGPTDVTSINWRPNDKRFCAID